jgi:hypothetical protein
MDTPSLVTLAVVIIAGIVVVQHVVLESAGRASDGIAQLFVPPDWRLGWPRGVQETDDPWGWRGAADVTRTVALAAEASSTDRPVLVELDSVDLDVAASEAMLVDIDSRGVRVPVRRVTRT